MGVSRPGDTWYHHFRRRSDNRRFYAAFGVSAVLHLSMVTVFSIVIHFPRHDLKFRDFTIVPVVAQGWPAAETPEPVPAASGAATSDQLALRGAAGSGPIGDIQLPTLEFAELERLRVRQESSRELSRYDELFQQPEQDSWARFSRSLSGLTRSLADLNIAGDGEEAGGQLALGQQQAAHATHRPAEGFEALIVWAGEPKDRQLLFAPPVEGLWNVDPADLTRPIEVVMQVNALGRVVNVFSPNVDSRELVDAVQMTALQYRFEPLSLKDGAMQTGTLRIRREQAEAPR